MKKFLTVFIFSALIASVMYASFPVVEDQPTSTAVEVVSSSSSPVSGNVDWPLAIVCFFVGVLGVHQFMLGNNVKGLLYIFTLGFCGIGVLIDLINICMGNLSR